MLLVVSDSQPGILCDCCEVKKLLQVYHCFKCNYDVCTPCAAQGMRCENPEHDWIERQVDESGRIVIHGRNTKGRKVEKALKSYPGSITAPDPPVDPQSVYENEHRFIRKDNPRRFLIYTDGACSNNGQSNPRASWAFVFRPSAYGEDGDLTHVGTISGRLKNKGPFGGFHK